VSRKFISTPAAPAAIGTYSQAVEINGTVYISGQIPLIPETGEMTQGSFEDQARQVFENLLAVAKAADGCLNQAVKFNVFLKDLANFAIVNKVMEDYLFAPYPARAAVQVAMLPKDAEIEVDAILVLN